MPIIKPLTAVLAAATLALAACGGDDDATEVLQQQGQQLQEQAEDLREKAQEDAAAVQAGEKDPEDAARELQAEADELQDDAVDTADDVLEETQEDRDLPAGADAQIDAAQEQLDELGD